MPLHTIQIVVCRAAQQYRMHKQHEYISTKKSTIFGTQCLVQTMTRNFLNYHNVYSSTHCFSHINTESGSLLLIWLMGQGFAFKEAIAKMSTGQRSTMMI